MAIVLALAAAVSWGSSDFVAGRAGRHSPGLSVVVGAHLTGLVVAGVLVAIGSGVPTGADMLWSAAGGLSGGIGAALLYRGLAIGKMSVVAPVTAAGAACLPVLAGLATGDVVPAQVLLGVGIALLAILLLSALGAPRMPEVNSGVRRLRKILVHQLMQPGLAEALLSGVGFAGFYVCLGRTSLEAGLWPLLGARLASVAVLGLFAVLTARQVLPKAGARLSVAAVGALDIAATLLYLAATWHGLLTVVAVLTSLYPAATVALARIVEKERCSRLQLSGVGVAFVGVVLIALG